MLQYAEFFNRLDAYGLQMTEHRLVVGPAWHGTTTNGYVGCVQRCHYDRARFQRCEWIWSGSQRSHYNVCGARVNQPVETDASVW